MIGFSFFDIILCMKETTKDKILNAVFIGVALVIVVIGLAHLTPTLKRYYALKDKEASVDAEIASTRRETSDYADRTRRFNSDSEQVEAVARQNHRVYPGEVVFVFEDKDAR